MTDHFPNLQPDGDPMVVLSGRMLSIRKSDEQLFRDVNPGRTPGRVHLSDRQETVVFAVCAHLGYRDQFVTSHRGQAHGLAMGGDRITAVGHDVRGVESA